MDSWPTGDYAQTALNTWSQSPYFSEAGTIAQNEGIDPAFFQATIGAESGYNPSAVNGDAYGIAQFMPATAQQYGVNRYDPESSLAGAATYFKNLLDECGGDYVCASAKYGTIPASGTNLTQNQQLVLQSAANADQSLGFKVTQNGTALNNVKLACGTFDVACYLSTYGTDALALLLGVIVLVIGAVMLKNNVDPGRAVNIITSGVTKRAASFARGAVAA